MKEKDYNYCFEESKGLRLIEPNENLEDVYNRKSRSALNMLQSAIEKKENEWILDTSYYAKYFMIYALFMKVGIKSEIHDCTLFILRTVFEKLGIVTPELCKEIELSRDLRVNSLYYNKDFSEDKIIERANKAPKFSLEIENIIDNLSKEDIKRIRDEFEELRLNY